MRQRKGHKRKGLWNRDRSSISRGEERGASSKVKSLLKLAAVHVLLCTVVLVLCLVGEGERRGKLERRGGGRKRVVRERS